MTLEDYKEAYKHIGPQALLSTREIHNLIDKQMKKYPLSQQEVAEIAFMEGIIMARDLICEKLEKERWQH